MRRTRAAWSATALTVVAGLVLAGCSQQSNTGAPDTGQPAVGFPETAPNPEQPGRPGGVFRLGSTEPTAIDPYNAQESEGIRVAEAIFTGLVEVQPDGAVTPGVASDWSANDNCSVWTFNLKPGTTFHNGETVDAASFKRGWERAAAKGSGSEVSYHLDVIQGYAEMQSGAATQLTGVDASNPDRLVVTLTKPDCEFELRTNHPVYSPVPTAVGATTDTAYTDAPIGNGPFRMDGKWQHNQGIRLVRFDDYTAGDKAFLDAVEITILPDANGAQLEYDGFNNGQFDWARMPPPLLAQARAANEPAGKWMSKKTNGINYFTVANTTAPLNSPEARKAISLAIDRNAIAQGVFQGAQSPATALVPPLFPEAYQDGVCEACRYDPAEAKRLAEQAGLTPGTELSLQFNTGGGHEEWTAAVRQQLETNLGLKVNYTGVPFTDLLNNEGAPGATGLFRSAWGADYPTPGNYLIPLLATSSIGAAPNEPVTGNNYGRYSNPQFDDLVARANASKDEAERNDLWKQAERIAIGQDLALIPLWARQQFRLVATDRFNNINMNFNENPTLEKISIK
ncbi:peptide ABC transporter substrate-binding protein [Pseudonocardia bannensis]|uniref:ABC transporter substrate-binding protein n=1 Tax=Pseudonocardia bannensis TaxID=630973 RepID=A0A848DGA5_9PSEU|nr:ABC transporter substrate-binding protein [Pseudonocardia bannensis]NMH91579.1 ABC transporter substrate-binding protein [Pseudonocardia bannensis]